MPAWKTLKNFALIARRRGFVFEAEGSGYSLWSNEHAPGIEAYYETLTEARDDIHSLYIGINPLGSIALPNADIPL